ncbi:methyltransferase [Candidatus Woesearchaeota archaeon]|nr:methyltransferase [Candidatus Woesearchaeota archaeon]
MIKSKKELAVLLSQLKTFHKPKLKLEQYQTDSEIAAELLWNAYLGGNIQKKVIMDLGCGNGILGIGALALGASEGVFCDIDDAALNLAIENCELIEGILTKKFKTSFSNCNFSECNKRVDVVLENPPFGTKNEHIDSLFLEQAFKLSKIVYSFHKIETKDFIINFAKSHGFKVIDIITFKMPLKATFSFHKKKIYNVGVGCFVLKKI